MNMNRTIEKYLSLAFRLHDALHGLLSKYIREFKIAILVVAHASLLGLLFPDMRKDFGEMAANLLILILFLSPLASITRMSLLRIAIGFRRELGVLMGYLALVHGLGYVIDPVFFELSVAPYLPGRVLSIEPFLLFGMVALLLTVPLLLTSNAFMLRKLGGVQWKRLHRLVYPMFALVVLHRFAVSGGVSDGFGNVIEAVVLLGGYSFLKFLAWKPEPSGIVRKAIDGIGEKYGTFRSAKNVAS